MHIEKNTLCAADFRMLFEAVGWEAPTLEQIEKALQGSLCVFSLYEGERLCGMARLLGDGGMSFYVKDFAVLPACQGKGAGRRLMEEMESYILASVPDGWAVSLELISSQGKEPFYEKFGFERRPCSWDGAGMFKMLRK